MWRPVAGTVVPGGVTAGIVVAILAARRGRLLWCRWSAGTAASTRPALVVVNIGAIAITGGTVTVTGDAVGSQCFHDGGSTL